MTARLRARQIVPCITRITTEVELSQSTHLTLDLASESKVFIHPLPAKSTGKGTFPTYPPSLRDILETLSVRLQEVPVPGASRSSQAENATTTSLSKKPRDWLNLLVKEAIGEGVRFECTSKLTPRSVDLKYLTPGQLVQVVYEGRPRRFRVVTSGDALDATDRLTAQMDALSVTSPRPRIWSVGWDAVVSLDTLDDPSSARPAEGAGLPSHVRRGRVARQDAHAHSPIPGRG
jgi:AAA family ATPase